MEKSKIDEEFEKLKKEIEDEDKFSLKGRTEVHCKAGDVIVVTAYQKGDPFMMLTTTPLFSYQGGHDCVHLSFHNSDVVSLYNHRIFKIDDSYRKEEREIRLATEEEVNDFWKVLGKHYTLQSFKDIPDEIMAKL